MLGMKVYDTNYIASCRETIERNVQAYQAQSGSNQDAEFEAIYFNAQVTLLAYMSVHRLSGIEGKDGNPLNEVRVLCNSLLLKGGRLQVDRLPGWPSSAV